MIKHKKKTKKKAKSEDSDDDKPKRKSKKSEDSDDDDKPKRKSKKNDSGSDDEPAEQPRRKLKDSEKEKKKTGPAAQKWSADKVIDWLEENNFDEFVSIFRKEKVTGSLLLTLDTNDLEEMHAPTGFKRKKLISAIGDLK